MIYRRFTAEFIIESCGFSEGSIDSNLHNAQMLTPDKNQKQNELIKIFLNET
jgi:hypothetical protein